MNYYERHIGDYLKDTAHLSLLEHGVYTRLLDVYYTRETPIPKSDVARLIGARSRDEKQALDAVLIEFFTLEADAYVQHRCDKEILKFADKSGKAKRSALARWDAKRLQSEGNADAMRTHSEGNAKAMLPVPNPQSQSPIPNTPKAPKGVDGFEEFWAAYPRKDAKPIALKAFLKVKAPVDQLLSAIAKQKQSEGWLKENGQFIPMPASWLNAERWNDGVMVVELDGDTRAAVEREGINKGQGPWDALAEDWATYKTRVRSSKSMPHLDLSKLGSMAAKAQGVHV